MPEPATPDKQPRRKADRRPREATNDQLLLNGKQSESSTGIPYRSIYDLYVRKQLKAVRFPGSRRLWFRRADILELIEKSLTTAE